MRQAKMSRIVMIADIKWYVLCARYCYSTFAFANSQLFETDAITLSLQLKA